MLLLLPWSRPLLATMLTLSDQCVSMTKNMLVSADCTFSHVSTTATVPAVKVELDQTAASFERCNFVSMLTFNDGGDSWIMHLNQFWGKYVCGIKLQNTNFPTAPPSLHPVLVGRTDEVYSDSTDAIVQQVVEYEDYYAFSNPYLPNSLSEAETSELGFLSASDAQKLIEV